ncbi:hypothetical protein MMC25_006170 [Agyrium rufum]|nr:hypothetical protein [Agyrium rufum]
MDAYEQASSDGNSFDPPPLMNQPPQLFGPYSSGSPVSADFAANFFDDPNGMGDESQDAKRRRIARACDMCRKKKIKCDGKMPACSHCLNYKTECIFTQVEKKRNPPKGAKYIEGLENRLGRMESLLKLSGLINEEDADRTDLGTLERRLADKSHLQHQGGHNGTITPAKSPSDSETHSQRRDSGESLRPVRVEGQRRPSRESPRPSVSSPNGKDKEKEKEKENEKEEEVEALSDMMCSLVTNNLGETRYIGSSSGFSIFSPKGIQWVNEKTGDNSFQDMITSAGGADDDKLAHWKPEVFTDIFRPTVYLRLPLLEESLSLLKDFFENFNCIFPLFHEPTFMHLVNRQYSRSPYIGSGWWASLNIALAIAHRLRVVSNLVPQEEDNKAWGYLKNALAVLTELTMRNTDLLSVQALLGMALFLQGTPNPQPSFVLVAAAIRLAHSIGLHKRGSGFNLNPVEVEQRKRVFWIAYLLDKDICLRSGRPPAQDDDDMNVELPSEDPGDNVGNIPLEDGKGKLNLFRLMCSFAIIESKVYKQLYSTKAAKQSDGALLNTIGELDHELEEWKDAIPIDFRPEHEIKASHTPLILHVVVLHFAYYNCLTTIHRMSVHHGYWTSRLSNYAIQGLNARPLNPRVFSSALLCVQAARASIHLIRYIPQGDYACVWMIIYYPVSALVTLFANILQNPQDARARSDIKLMNQVVHFLSLLISGEEQNGVGRMHAVCAEFERIAKVVLDKADKESRRRKRKSNIVPGEKDKSLPGQQQQVNGDDPLANGNLISPKSTSGGGTKRPLPREANNHNDATSSSTTNASTPQSSLFPPAFAGDLNNPSPSPSATFAAFHALNQQPHTNGGAFSSPHSTTTDGTGMSSLNGSTAGGGGRHFIATMPDFMPAPGDFPNMMTPMNSFADFAGAASYDSPDGGIGFGDKYGNGGGGGTGGGGSGPLNAGSFHQPFVPQDLWQMPMTLEWDWADMSGGIGGAGGGSGSAGGGGGGGIGGSMAGISTGRGAVAGAGGGSIGGMPHDTGLDDGERNGGQQMVNGL